jgi:hypothetical protein
MKDYHKIISAMILKTTKKYSIGIGPSFARAYFYEKDRASAHDIARWISKNAGMPIIEELQYDPVIARRIDLLVHFWRFVAFSVKCEDKGIFRVVRSKYIDIIQNKYFK